MVTSDFPFSDQSSSELMAIWALIEVDTVFSGFAGASCAVEFHFARWVCGRFRGRLKHNRLTSKQWHGRESQGQIRTDC